MEPVAVTSYVVYSLFAGLWVGSVLFVAVGILPMARRGELNATPLQSVARTLTRVSRLSALALLLTGAHIALTGYSIDSLTGTTDGRLVLGTVVLWFVLAGVVEVGTSRLREGTERDKVREPARGAWRLFVIAAVVAAGLLVVSGLLSAWSAGYL